MKKSALAIILLISLSILFLGCTESTETQSTCSELNGYICQSKESCYGQKLNASDSDNCCAIVCNKTNNDTNNPTLNNSPSVNTPNTKTNLSLEEINLSLSDFSSDFELDESASGYQKNALEYVNGDKEQAQKLLDNGWQENHQIHVFRAEKKTEYNDNPTILEEYRVALNRYDRSKDNSDFLAGIITNFKTEIGTDGGEELSIKFGDNSSVGKYLFFESGQKYKIYDITFIKNDIFVLVIASGLSRQIDESRVIEIARLIESRIK